MTDTIIDLYWSEAYSASGIDRETTRKSSYVAASLAADPVPGVRLGAPSPATPDEFGAVHDGAYVEAVRHGSPAWLARSNGIGWTAELFSAVAASTGGVRDAALTAMRTGIAGSLSSGLHHARAGEGNGFCTFNGLVVAARAALRAGAGRVLVVDLDAHCGGGTASMLARVPGLEQVDVSLSSFDAYSSRPGARLWLPTRDSYLETVTEALDSVEDPAGVGLVLYNAGMDVHRSAGTPGGLDDDQVRQRERLVFDWARSRGLPVAFVLAGGYLDPCTMDELVSLHRITIEVAACSR